MISRNRTFVTVYLAGACEKQPHTVLSLIPSLQGLEPNVILTADRWMVGLHLGSLATSYHVRTLFVDLLGHQYVLRTYEPSRLDRASRKL